MFREPSGPEAPARTFAQQDAVIVKLSAAGKALRRITLREASVQSLVFAPDRVSVKKLKLSYEQIEDRRL